MCLTRESVGGSGDAAARHRNVLKLHAICFAHEHLLAIFHWHFKTRIWPNVAQPRLRSSNLSPRAEERSPAVSFTGPASSATPERSQSRRQPCPCHRPRPLHAYCGGQTERAKILSAPRWVGSLSPDTINSGAVRCAAFSGITAGESGPKKLR